MKKQHWNFTFDIFENSFYSEWLLVMETHFWFAGILNKKQSKASLTKLTL